MAENKQDISALRQEIKAQRERLIEEKIEKGLAVRQPILAVAALDPTHDYNAVSIDERGREIYPPEMIVITGVQRGEGSAYVAALLESAGIEPGDRYASMKTKAVEEKRPAPRPQPTPELPASSPRYPVRCTVRGPNPDKNDPGQIIEASYAVSGNLLSVYDEEGCKLGTATVRPGDDLDAAARAVVREKHGKHAAFYDPIYYRGSVV